jgi:hypothetical protein
MLGYDTKSKDKSGRNGNMMVYTRKNSQDLILAENFVKHGKKITGKVKFKVDQSGFNSSDHRHFWDNNYPAILVTQDRENDLNPNNHTEKDFVETLNFKTLYGSLLHTLGVIGAWNFPK